MMINFQDKNYINTEAKLQALDKEISKRNPELLAFDTETNGLLFYRNVVIGFSISMDSKEGYYIPFLEWQANTGVVKKRSVKSKKYECFTNGNFKDIWTGKTYEEFVSPKEYRPSNILVEYLKKWTKGRKLLMHNAPFDCNMVKSNTSVDLTTSLHCDTMLLKHILDENTPLGLKPTAALWKRELGFSADEDAKKEQKEMGESVIRNGGEFTGRNKHIWRADPRLIAKYAAADTALTYGLYEVGMRKLESDYKSKHLKWFFEDEVMPLCKEVIIPMQFQGTYIDVPYFQQLKKETEEILTKWEDEVIQKMGNLLDDFRVGQSKEMAVKDRNIVEVIIKREGLPYPTIVVKGVEKKSLNKKAVEAQHKKDPHWLWAYMLGLDEIKYDSATLEKIKNEIYIQKVGRRYRFNIKSNPHLRWLLFTKLGESMDRIPITKNSTPENPVPALTAAVLKEFFYDKYEFIAPLLRYRKIYKLYSSYIEPALNLNENGWLHMDIMQPGTISGRFAIRGGFNLQTLPRVKDFSECPKCEKKNVKTHKTFALLIDADCPDCGYKARDLSDGGGIKKGFIAPPGYKIVNADFEALEPRCFAFVSGDDKLKDIFKKGLDMYSKVYIDMEGEHDKYSANPKDKNFLKKINKALRDSVKPCILGIPYGARGPQVARLMGFKRKKVLETGEEIETMDVDRGRQFRDKYLSTFKSLHKYMIRCELNACTKGYVETLVGRRRHFSWAPIVYEVLSEAGVTIEEFLDLSKKKLEQHSPTPQLNRRRLSQICVRKGVDYLDIADKGYWSYIKAVFKNELDNAKNFPIQALAAHIANKSMLDISRKLRQNRVDGYVFLQVHDEISVYAKIEQIDDGAKILQESMENNEYTALLDIKMKAAPIICDNLMESK